MLMCQTDVSPISSYIVGTRCCCEHFALPALSTTAHLAVPALRLRALRIALDFDGEEDDDDR